MLNQPYTVKSEGGTITREGSRSGVLSLADILHSFVFPYFGNKTDKGIHNLDIALTTLEVFLQKAVDEKACSPQEVRGSLRNKSCLCLCLSLFFFRYSSYVLFITIKFKNLN